VRVLQSLRAKEEAHRHVSRYDPAEEAGHALMHGFGLLFSAAAFVALVLPASASVDGWRVGAFAVFGTTLVLLYAASTLHDGIQSLRMKRLLQRLDHVIRSRSGSFHSIRETHPDRLSTAR
jgi:hemolysin III